jgi:hypothetical protein
MSKSIYFAAFILWSALSVSLSASVTTAQTISLTDSHQQKKMPPAKTSNIETSTATTKIFRKVLELHGGNTEIATSSTSQATQPAPNASKSNSLRQTTIKNMLAGWGVIQVLSILANTIKRVTPVAIQPFVQRDLQPLQAVICAAWCIYMVYTEGYKTFQLKFSPLVVKRAFGLSKNASILNCLFAGPYSMGLFGATRKRMIVSWSVTLGVFTIVKIVKKLPYPWRSIVDSGVVLGLAYGALAMVFQTARAMFGYYPDVDECLPIKSTEQSERKKAI